MVGNPPPFLEFSFFDFCLLSYPPTCRRLMCGLGLQVVPHLVVTCDLLVVLLRCFVHIFLEHFIVMGGPRRTCVLGFNFDVSYTLVRNVKQPTQVGTTASPMYRNKVECSATRSSTRLFSPNNELGRECVCVGVMDVMDVILRSYMATGLSCVVSLRRVGA